MSKLTPLIIAKYLGAPILYKVPHTDDSVIVNDYTISKDTLNFSFKTKASRGGSYGQSCDGCQLILKPLSEIRDEDKIEVAKLFKNGEPLFPNQNYLSLGNYFIECLLKNKWVLDCDFSAYTKIIDYLRSSVRPDGTPKAAYDCDNLIEQGIAIAETKNEQS